jgi:hypothetical protein
MLLPAPWGGGEGRGLYCGGGLPVLLLSPVNISWDEWGQGVIITFDLGFEAEIGVPREALACTLG